MEHPDIAAILRTGYPRGHEDNGPVCPICGAEADTFFKDTHGDIFGCCECVTKVDAWEV